MKFREREGLHPEQHIPTLPNIFIEKALIAQDCPYTVTVNPETCARVLQAAGLSESNIPQITVAVKRSDPLIDRYNNPDKYDTGGYYNPRTKTITLLTDKVWQHYKNTTTLAGTAITNLYEDSKTASREEKAQFEKDLEKSGFHAVFVQHESFHHFSNYLYRPTIISQHLGHEAWHAFEDFATETEKKKIRRNHTKLRIANQKERIIFISGTGLIAGAASSLIGADLQTAAPLAAEISLATLLIVLGGSIHYRSKLSYEELKHLRYLNKPEELAAEHMAKKVKKDRSLHDAIRIYPKTPILSEDSLPDSL